ncbi:hypothetical protein GGS23DRAFT_597561 [Durotheca rogersii]|uniref:uncharacterized protein n=1 Tax=Durotheca rogersii TaxID=419775 RepID=UPI002220E8C2|nr:uncharacterized protein GGS23DRAFT_597561 [Durotheca rogersii]KAI5862334.1 hypothetical protein GGS23DRAFT_597561 [Durotheca rogersii]
MAPSLRYRRDELDDNHGIPASAYLGEPLGALAGGLVLSFGAISVVSCFLTQRSPAMKTCWRLPLIVWLVLAIHANSWIFTFVVTVVRYGVGINSSPSICSGSIIQCLSSYLITKVRLACSPVYLLATHERNPTFLAVCVLNFVFRIAHVDDDGRCIIGVQKQALLPLIMFDFTVHTYLTILFLAPLRNIYSSKNLQLARTPANLSRLRAVAVRNLVGALSATIVSAINLGVLAALGGEPGWVCLMCYNADVLFSAVVVQWITSRDNVGAAIRTTLPGECPVPSAPTPAFLCPDARLLRHPSLSSPPHPHTNTATPPCDNRSDGGTSSNRSPSPGRSSQSRRNSAGSSGVSEKRLAISRPLAATSTFQYERVFRDDRETRGAAADSAAEAVASGMDRLRLDPAGRSVPATVSTEPAAPAPDAGSDGRRETGGATWASQRGQRRMQTRTRSHGPLGGAAAGQATQGGGSGAGATELRGGDNGNGNAFRLLSSLTASPAYPSLYASSCYPATSPPPPYVCAASARSPPRPVCGNTEDLRRQPQACAYRIGDLAFDGARGPAKPGDGAGAREIEDVLDARWRDPLQLGGGSAGEGADTGGWI